MKDDIIDKIWSLHCSGAPIGEIAATLGVRKEDVRRAIVRQWQVDREAARRIAFDRED